MTTPKADLDELEKCLRAMHPRDFEEFCAQLVTELGFVSVRRQGSGTQFGHDIAAELVGSGRSESWVFECKRYARRIPLKELSNKLLWADAQKSLDAFVIMSNAEISNDFRQLLKLASTRRYEVLMWTGPTFRRLIAACPYTAKVWFRHLPVAAPVPAGGFLGEQRARPVHVGQPDGSEMVTVTISRAPRTPGENPSYAVIFDATGNRIAKIVLKRGHAVRIQLPKSALEKPVSIVYDFEPYAAVARPYPRVENLVLGREMCLPSEHLKTRTRAVAGIPMDRWRRYTGLFHQPR